MITFLRFSRSMGRCGNQIMQYMSLIGMAKKYDCELQLPRWEYAPFFKNPPKQFDEDPVPQVMIQEPSFNYVPQVFDQYRDHYKNKIVNINGWLQSYHYWENAVDEVRSALEFTDELKEAVKAKLHPDFFNKPVIAISVRRGDYCNNTNYELLTAKYYIMALYDKFPDFHDKYHIMFFSDDIAYCKVHFQCLSNAYFADNLNVIEQLCAGGVFCDHAIIANSTFSHCIAMLQELNGKNPIVVRPVDIFKGQMKNDNDITDHYPTNWFLFNHNFVKMNLLDVTFTIPVSFDSNERRENLKLCVNALNDFETNIIIGEHGRHKYFEAYGKLPRVKYHYFEGMTEFHRTKMLNDMARMCETPIVVNWDADVIVPPMQILEAVRLIKEKRVDMVYPYDGRFARVNPRTSWVPLLYKYNDPGVFGGTEFLGMERNGVFNGPYSVGGAVMYATDKFIEGGMENENMISYAPEDSERYQRFNRLGFAIDRVKGVLYHIDHPLTVNSSLNHPHYHKNSREYDKICKMSNEELQNYVRSWPWANQYRPSYYESIHEESVKSRDVVFDILKSWKFLKPGLSIIDVGCGCGSWGFELDKDGIDYTGLDFGVPEDKIVIKKHQYIDFDLRTPSDFHLKPKYDLALCLEVFEHIDEQFADQAVDTVCALSETILFGAAIPGQGGMQHVNEQWQSYWAKKFAARGYFPYYYEDIRDEIWHNEEVGLWYRQNIVLYLKTGAGDEHYYELDRVHPKMWTNVLKSAGVIR